MSQTIEAIYQNGMFVPVNPISEGIGEGEKVEITINEKRLSPEEMLKLASRVYEGLSGEGIAEIERIALDRSNLFGDRKLYKRGSIIMDADILIAATAIENNLPIVTNNENHFNRISDLQILNWNK